ncbi:RHS repeat-associated core domain protein-containing protein [Pseudomonas sp. GM80]|nr:RHS repeat-associated core domain protein-containing protein [Pseudomonas sp. GM80]
MMSLPRHKMTINNWLTSAGLYSQASNFIGHVTTDVDRRTGQFTLAAKLPSLQANNLAGPIVSLSLHFSPLASHTDMGFGLGWQLGVSMLDLNTDRLSLLTGDQYRLDRRKSDFSDGGLLVFHDQKLRSFVVRQMGTNGRVFRVEHKSGDTEWLEVQERSGLAMIVQMRSPQGRQAFFRWLPRGNNQFGLDSIWDERGPELPLLRVAMSREAVVFTLFPGSDSESKITLQQVNGKLTQLILPDEDSRWTFDYLTDKDSGLLFPNRVLGPLGSEDSVQYATGNQGHRLPPGAPLAWLPRVVSHRHSPGAGQPDIHRQFKWIGTSNFLGGDVAPPGGWQDGIDNLYRMTSYRYSNIETVLNEKGETLATAERTWNRFHLQTKEVTTRHSTRLQDGVSVAEQKVITFETIYGDDPDKSWEQQEAWCQLPIATVTRYEDGVQPPREVREETDYDDYGNVLQKRFADGRIETTEFYPLGGSEGCPDDGREFIRWVKSTTLMPAPVPGGGTGGVSPTQTRRRYALLPKRQIDDVQNLIANEETALVLASPTEQLIGTTTQGWDLNPASAFFGQPIQSINTLNGYATTTTFARTFDAEGLHETQTLTGHDGLAVISNTVRHSLTGLTLIELSEDAVATTYAYDTLGRVVRRTESAGTEYEVSSFCSFITAGKNRDKAVTVEETDITGQKRRLLLDGSGRPVREERQDSDITGQQFREVWSGVYGHDGELLSETVQDWLPGLTSPIRLTTRKDLDAWGQISAQHQPDGTSQHTIQDPITLISRHWQQSRTGERGAETEMVRNRAGEIEQVTVRAPRIADGQPGAVLRVEKWTFDGLYRPISHQIIADGVTTTTRTERDVFGRTHRVTREDGSVVHWAYAMHSDGDHPVMVSLTPADGSAQVLATQTFDGLGRSVQLQAGGQTESLNYLKGQLPPASATQADGRQIDFRYEKKLDNALIAAVPQGDSGYVCTYRPPEGFPSKIQGGLGMITQEYSASGRPIKEQWTVAGETHTTTVAAQSLIGRAIHLTDVGGTVHQIEYDQWGRTKVQQAGSISVHFSYDDFGRIHTITTIDSTNNRSLEQSLSYDSFGRELSRTWQNAEGKTVQTLAFTGRDKVALRRWELDGLLHSEERYTYDERGRLLQSTATGPDAPLDTRTGKRISQQMFTLNALDGYQKLDTTFVDGTRNTMSFRYDPVAPDRPVAITHRGVQDTDIELKWDANGRLIEEWRNATLYRKLAWDANGRVREISENGASSLYRYDPLGRLGEQETAKGTARRFYINDQMINERAPNGAMLTMVRSTDAVFAESRLSQSIRSVLLTGTDGQGSMRLENNGANRLLSYSDHGDDDGTAQSRVGYAGELRDVVTGLYHPGSYRPYDPQLMLFLAPDSASPLGDGGLNRYAYCGGDPVNRVDPDGHSFWSWFGAALGVVLGAVAIVASFGVLAPVVTSAFVAVTAAVTAGSVTGAIAAGVAGVSAVLGAITPGVIIAATTVTLGTVAAATGLASPIAEVTGNQQAAEILGWISLGTGVAASLVALAPAMGKTITKVGSFVGRWQHNLQNAGGVPRFASSSSGAARLAGRTATNHLAKLPDGAMENLIRYLPGSDLKNLSLTSRRMNDLVSSNTRPLNKVLPSFSNETRTAYVQKVRKIWVGEEPGVLPSQLSKANVDVTMSISPPLNPGPGTNLLTMASMGFDDLPWLQTLSKMNFDYLRRFRRWSI